MNRAGLIITCEHAGKEIPVQYKSLFAQSEAVIDTHEGWDPGAWEVASHLSTALGVKAFGCHTTRLLIEVNRSLNSHQLFSRYTVGLGAQQKQELISEIYLPYRHEVQHKIEHLPYPVIHLSIHSFTPVLNGQERNVDIGLLFDPARQRESSFCQKYRDALISIDPQLNIRYNQPYLGTDDGFTTYLRGIFDDTNYAGIEIEVNQKFLANLEPIKNTLVSGLERLI